MINASLSKEKLDFCSLCVIANIKLIQIDCVKKYSEFEFLCALNVLLLQFFFSDQITDDLFVIITSFNSPRKGSNYALVQKLLFVGSIHEISKKFKNKIKSSKILIKSVSKQLFRVEVLLAHGERRVSIYRFYDLQRLKILRWKIREQIIWRKCIGIYSDLVDSLY